MVTEVGIVVLGAAGYMGQQGLEAIEGRRAELEARGIKIKLISLVDPTFFNSEDEEVAFAARNLTRPAMSKLNYCHFECTAKMTIREMIQRLFGGLSFPRPTIFYDATSTQFHTQHLYLVHDLRELGFSYFGEKPIFRDVIAMKNFIENLEPDYEYYCDFIETENPVIRAVRDFIDDASFEMEAMRFWRAGSSGLKHIVGHNQIGVQGGAWLDKAAHDLSIANSLVLNKSITSSIVEEAEFISFIPYKNNQSAYSYLPSYPQYFDENGFDISNSIDPSDLTFKIRSDDGNTQELPADGQTFARFSLKCEHTPNIALQVLSGWTGYHGFHQKELESQPEAIFTNLLEELKIERKDWLFSERFYGKNTNLGNYCIESQARIMVIEGKIDGDDHLIVANLIHTNKNDELERRALRRWSKVYRKTRSGYVLQKELKFDLKETYADQKKEDLGRIIEKVVLSASGLSQNSNDVSSEAVKLVHELLLGAHNLAIQNAQNNVAQIQSNATAEGELIASMIISNEQTMR